MSAPARLRVVHVITGLGYGGAERMLERLLGALDPREFESAVWSLGGVGPIGARLTAQGIPVHALCLDPRLPSPLKVLRLARWMRAWRPALVQTWMYHADLVGGIAALLAGRVPTVWNLRQSTLERGRTRGTTLAVARACAMLSNVLPARIVSCIALSVTPPRASNASRTVSISNASGPMAARAGRCAASSVSSPTCRSSAWSRVAIRRRITAASWRRRASSPRSGRTCATCCAARA
jgi:hypothetical protein